MIGEPSLDHGAIGIVQLAVHVGGQQFDGQLIAGLKWDHTQIRDASIPLSFCRA